jgi:hypothetical protein
MELIQKYRLALLQLQTYSDNNLIIQEDTVLNITDELKEIESHEYELLLEEWAQGAQNRFRNNDFRSFEEWAEAKKENEEEL